MAAGKGAPVTIPSWINRIIVELYRLVGGIAPGRTLLLRTTGPKTGRTYVTPLFYVEEGGAFIVVGSYAGGPKDPSWIGHLRAATPVAIEIGRKSLPVRAEFADRTDAERLYRRFITERGRNYEEYLERTSRAIPVVRLIPTAGRGGA